MLQIKKITDALLHLVGWEQDFNPAMAIDEAMTESESGLYFQGAHPLCTLNNVRSIMPEDWVMQYPEWNMISAYKAGAKVKHHDIVWIALADNVNSEPNYHDFNGDYSADFNDPYWKPYNFTSDYLERLTRNGITKVVTNFIKEKQLTRETHSIVEHRTLFDGAGRLANTIRNTNKIVGFEITPVRAMGVTTKIERIGFQFTGEGEFTLYLFHSNKIDPVATKRIHYTGRGSYQWFDLKDWYLPYISADTNAGGSWFVCYNQRELPAGMEAINISKDWSREPCSTCNVGSVEVWREITKYIQIVPFAQHAPTTFDEYPEMWDIATMAYMNTNCYGMNAEVTIGCDLTDFIIQQRNIFASVVQLQVVADMLRTLAMNPDVRVNRNQSNASRMDILYEIDGNTEGRATGLSFELMKAYKALRLDTQSLDRVCLACSNGGVRYRTA